MRGIYLCALCESLLDRIIKLRTYFNCAKLKFVLSTLAKQMTSNTVVVESHCPANVLLASQVKWPWLNLYCYLLTARPFSFQRCYPIEERKQE